MSVRVAEIGAPSAVLAAVDLGGPPAAGVGVEGDAAVPDAGEGGLEFVIRQQERVVV
jgi:hypothetical protein